MASSTRKQLLGLANQAIDKLDVLDEILYNMDSKQGGRQPAIVKMIPILLEGHEGLRKLWVLLKEQL